MPVFVWVFGWVDRLWAAMRWIISHAFSNRSNAPLVEPDHHINPNTPLQMLSVVHKFLGSSVLLPSLSAASNLVQSPLAGAPPPSFYAVLHAVHLWVDTYKVRETRRASMAGLACA
jgi:hypothetical protein